MMEYITGMNIIELRDKLAAGYTLQPPKQYKALCPECNGSGFVQIAPGVRGIKACPVCTVSGRLTWNEK